MGRMSNQTFSVTTHCLRAKNTPTGKRMLTLATRVGEFKKKNTREEPCSKRPKTNTVASLPPIDEKMELTTPAPAETADTFFSSPSAASGTTLFAAGLSSTPGSLHSIDPSFSSPFIGSSTTKRKRDDESEDVEERAKEILLAEVTATSDVSEDHRQLAIYAMACLSSAARLYTTSIFVDGFQITMFYYDRRLVARSVSFNFSQQPQYLAVLVYAMLATDYRNDGMPASAYDYAVIQEEEGGPPIRVTPATDGVQCFAFFDMAEIIHKAIGLAPSCKGYLPETVYGGVFSAESLGLPSMTDSIPTDKLPHFVTRALHVVVSKLYYQIWMVSSVADFTKIWFDCVRCHHAAWAEGRVLHRDLSENNLMFHLKESKNASVREVEGILNDWDMASTLDEDGHPETTAATHRTGTIPFMSPDLLDLNPPRHYYRHNLESFVWIFLYATAHYNIHKKRKEPLSEALKAWNGPTMDADLGMKLMLLNSRGADRLQSGVRPEWKDLLDTVGLVLLELIPEAHHLKAVANSISKNFAKR
ncbi:hypothetical protein BKA70DRAFT_1463314 [Coprinopsis sp. MPI-PUGE-AT-0042]|nr:hypothetical protein BKA70DRAFT_1463314 [Coprinopsis sp. MPI-PUGE-AT-0042]